MGSSFECVGVARELILVKFFQIFGEQCHTFGYLGRLDSGHIVIFLRNKGLYPRNYYILFIL